MKVEQLHEQTTKQFSKSTPIPKIAHYGPKSQKMTPTLSQNQMPELKETQKMKVVQLPEQTPKQLSNPTPTPEKPFKAQKVKKYPKIKQKQISEFTETYKMRIVQLYEQTPKQFEPDPNPQNSLFLPGKKTKKNSNVELYLYF